MTGVASPAPRLIHLEWHTAPLFDEFGRSSATSYLAVYTNPITGERWEARITDSGDDAFWRIVPERARAREIPDAIAVGALASVDQAQTIVEAILGVVARGAS